MTLIVYLFQLLYWIVLHFFVYIFFNLDIFFTKNNSIQSFVIVNYIFKTIKYSYIIIFNLLFNQFTYCRFSCSIFTKYNAISMFKINIIIFEYFFIS